MQLLPPIISQKKNLIIEVAVLCIFLGGMYYLYTSFSEQDATTTPAANQQLLGQNMTLFLQATSDGQFSFNKTDFLSSALVNQLQDYSQVILPNTSRGRLDPFTPYASSRSLR